MENVGIGTIGVLRCLGLVAVSKICLSLIWYWLRRFWLIVAEDNRCFFFYLKKFCWHCRQNHVFFFPAFSHYQRKNKSYKYIYTYYISSERLFKIIHLTHQNANYTTTTLHHSIWVSTRTNIYQQNHFSYWTFRVGLKSVHPKHSCYWTRTNFSFLLFQSFSLMWSSFIVLG